MKNKTLPTFWIFGVFLIMAYGFGYGLDASVEARKLLSFSGIILYFVFAILMMVRMWKLDICKTTVKIWLLGSASMGVSIRTSIGITIFGSEFYEVYNSYLFFFGQLTCLACLIRASYLLYKTPDIATP